MSEEHRKTREPTSQISKSLPIDLDMKDDRQHVVRGQGLASDGEQQNHESTVTVNTERSFTASFTEARAFAMASCRCAGNPALHLAILLTSLLYKSIKLHEGGVLLDVFEGSMA
jgi:hypothetical protein